MSSIVFYVSNRLLFAVDDCNQPAILELPLVFFSPLLLLTPTRG